MAKVNYYLTHKHQYTEFTASKKLFL